MSDSMHSVKIDRIVLTAPPMHVANPHDDSHIANGLAQDVAQAIRGAKGE